MFQRREKRTLTQNFREVVWPKMGWYRAYRYFRHRVKRLPGTPYYIAAGFASGAAVSFTPFIGFHILLGLGLAYLLRASLIASVFGTLIGNPWTFPFIWMGTYELGMAFLGERAADLPKHLSFSLILSKPWKLLLPMGMGALPCAVVAWFLVYFPVRDIVGRYQLRRHRKRVRRLEKLRELRGEKEEM